MGVAKELNVLAPKCHNPLPHPTTASHVPAGVIVLRGDASLRPWSPYDEDIVKDREQLRIPRLSLFCLGLAATLLVMSGCGGKPRGAVAGQPVDGGTITFMPQGERQREPGWGEITAGEYSIPASKGPAVGVSRVEIHWPRKTGKKARYDPKIDEMREAIPNRYNRDSELKADVKPGNNPFDFALRSQ